MTQPQVPADVYLAAVRLWVNMPENQAANLEKVTAWFSLSRCQKGSNRRKKAVKRVALLYENTARRRRGFCHRVSRDLVNRFDLVAVENLNIKGLAKGLFAKHVLDACWGTFICFLTYKAANAGRELIKVDPAYTSQECPACGRITPKNRKCLDIAAAEVFKRSQGTWTAFIKAAHEMNPWLCTYVECVHNERLAAWLLKNGYVATGDYPQSFYLLKEPL